MLLSSGIDLSHGDIGYNTLQSSNGVIMTKPMNINGNYTLFFLSKYLIRFSSANEKSIDIQNKVDYSYQKLYLNSLLVPYKSTNFLTTISLKQKIGEDFFYNISLNNKVSSFSYDNQSIQNRISLNSDLNTYVKWYNKRWEFTLDSDAKYVNYSKSYQQLIPIISMFLNYNLMNNIGFIRINVFDVLNKNKNIYQTSSENTINTGSTNVIIRYSMVSFVYNFRKFFTKK